MNERDYEGATEPFDAALARAKYSDWKHNHRKETEREQPQTLEEDPRGTEHDHR
jgi:hypothetical protein